MPREKWKIETATNCSIIYFSNSCRTKLLLPRLAWMSHVQECSWSGQCTAIKVFQVFCRWLPPVSAAGRRGQLPSTDILQGNSVTTFFSFHDFWHFTVVKHSLPVLSLHQLQQPESYFSRWAMIYFVLSIKYFMSVLFSISGVTAP